MILYVLRSGIWEINLYRVHPFPIISSASAAAMDKRKKRYFLITSEDMEAEGIPGYRVKLASFLKDFGVRSTSTFLVIVYAIYVMVLLAIEEEVYKSSTAVIILEILELLWIFFFTIEIIAFLISFGPKLY